jgi:hypothetical protein
MNTSTCRRILKELALGRWVYPLMDVNAGEDFYEYGLHGTSSSELSRVLPPSSWPEYFSSEAPCIGLEYGAGSLVHVLPTSAIPPEVLDFISSEDSHTWEFWSFDPEAPYVMVDLSASGDVVESLSDVTEESLRLDD